MCVDVSQSVTLSDAYVYVQSDKVTLKDVYMKTYNRRKRDQWI